MSTKKAAFLIIAVLVAVFYGTTHIASAYGGASVDVANFAFNPSPVTIQVGDTVTWTNSQGFHNVRADDDSYMNTPGSGWTFTHTFTAPGTYEYYCEIHSSPTGTNMNGVVVVEAPTAVSVDSFGVTSNPMWVTGMAGAGLVALAGVLVALRRKNTQA